jgi:hypothetical protein
MVGATGRHAHLVLDELTNRGVAVRALVRNEERARVARDNGAEEAATGDLTDPATLTGAVAGMDGVFHIGPAHAAGEGIVDARTARSSDRGDPKHWIILNDALEVIQRRAAVNRKEGARAGCELEILAQDSGAITGEVLHQGHVLAPALP